MEKFLAQSICSIMLCGSHILSSAGFLVFLLPDKGEKGFSFCGKICQMFHITKLEKKKHPASYM